jgi:alkylation response protein AidB-like acyl-CoA dehydrogenase
MLQCCYRQSPDTRRKSCESGRGSGPKENERMSLACTAKGLSRADLEMVLQSFQEFAERRLAPALLLDLDARNECPEATIREMCGPGLEIQLVFLPEEYGGMGGSAYDVYRTCEALARVDLGVATGVLATLLGSDPLRFGTLDQKKLWLTKIAEEGAIMAYGATEPQAGSDLGALRTVAVPVEEAGKRVGYRLTGSKQWISNGGFADVYSILANAPGGPSWFIVEKGLPGFSHGKHEDKHGIRLSNTAALSLEDVYVPADRLVGGVEGQGLQQAQAVFGYTRLMVAAFGLGAGWAALDKAIPYSKERIQAGAPLSEKQGYTHKLIVPHAVRLEAARAYVEETAERLDADEEGLQTEGAIAKYLASEAGNAACEAAIQALGGYGYTREYQVEKWKRDVRITTIYEGTSEIMEMTISRDRWQQHLKSRGQHYHDKARELEELHGRRPDVGAGAAALCLHALAAILERCRAARLTRHQHVLFRLGELTARAEGTAALARRAARAAEGALDERADTRFTPEALAAVSRISSREAALDLAAGGLRIVLGAETQPGEATAFSSEVGLSAIQAAQTGLLADMDRVADALYGRTSGSGSTSSS